MNSVRLFVGTTSCRDGDRPFLEYSLLYKIPSFTTKLCHCPQTILTASDSVMTSSGRGWLVCRRRSLRTGPMSGSWSWRTFIGSPAEACSGGPDFFESEDVTARNIRTSPTPFPAPIQVSGPWSVSHFKVKLLNEGLPTGSLTDGLRCPF